MKESRFGLALVVMEAEEDMAAIPKEDKHLLIEYQDVLTNSLPSGLPPLRDIQHTIDLIPSLYYLTDQPID